MLSFQTTISLSFNSHQEAFSSSLLSSLSGIICISEDFIFLGSTITVDGDCSHEIKRHLLLGRKAMTNLNSELKSRDVILQMKVCIVKAMVFPLVMDRCESWTIKKAEH